jgi:hypothetical protein
MSAFASISQSCIEGALLACPRGDWALDGKPVKTGRDGVRVALLMDSTTVGEIKFGKDDVTGFVRVIDQRVGRLEDGFQPAKHLEKGWNRSTAIVCVGVSADICSQVMTFRSSSMGGFVALRALMPTYVRFGEKLYPVAYLETKSGTRGGNPVVDPVFVAENWLPRENFSAPALPPRDPPLPPGLTEKAVISFGKATGADPEMVRGEVIVLAERERAEAEKGPTTAEIIDDDIPF